MLLKRKRFKMEGIEGKKPFMKIMGIRPMGFNILKGKTRTLLGQHVLVSRDNN